MAQAIQQSKDVHHYTEEIACYERKFSSWSDLSKKIVKRYKDETTDSKGGKARFNILWSNVQTLGPALFSKNPIPNIDRRFESDDTQGTTTARVLERATSYFVDTDNFSNVVTQAVLDRLLGGRGTVWVRYVPHFVDKAVDGVEDVREQGAQATDDVVKGEPSDEDSQEPDEELYSEDVAYDYVHWEDFLHGWGRTWEEVEWVGRRVYMTRRQMKDRGFKGWQRIPLAEKEDDDTSKKPSKKAAIYEIWDKTRKKAYWIHKDMPDVLDERDDPLGLKDFFPCPKPLYATLGNDDLIPVPDFKQYEAQAKELDMLTARINSLTKAVKVVGVYDASAEGLSRVLTEGHENTMIPVEKWAVFGEKGGMKGAVDWLPMEQIVATLVQLYDARDRLKQDIYEITGISDIIRGATDPNETLGAQELKGKFASLRMDNQQKDAARFCRDLVRITAQIIAEHFSIDTIKQICGIKLFMSAEKAIVQQQLQAAQAMGQEAPIPDEIQELMEEPTWEEVEALLRDDVQRCFRISIETDSTIKTDQEAEKAARVELLSAVGSYLQVAATVPPQLQPLAARLLEFGVKGYKVSREIETTFDIAMKKIAQQAEQPPVPSPDELKIQLEQQRMQAEVQDKAESRALEREKLAQEDKKMGIDYEAKKADFALRQQEMAQKGREHEANVGMELERMDHDKYKSRLDAKSKVAPDVALSDPDLQEGGAQTPMSQLLMAMMQMMQEGFAQIAAAQQQGNLAVMDAIQQPRKTEVIRGKDGKIQGGVSHVVNQTVQ